MTLSEAATATHSFLRTIPNSVACEKCLAAYLDVDRYEVLKSIRELIHAGRILCTYTECAICQERSLVAHVRAQRRQSSDT